MGILRSDFIQIRALLLAGNSISGKFSDLSVPQCPHLKTVITIAPHRVTVRTNESTDVKLVTRPDTRKSPGNASSSVMRTAAAATRLVMEEEVETLAV